MESNIFKGTKNDFSHFLDMALQKRMPWNILALLFKNLAPTLNETIEVINILLKELESLQSTLQEKEKLLEKYQREGENFEKTESTNIENCVSTKETESVGVTFHEHESEPEIVEDEIGVLEVDQDMSFEGIETDYNTTDNDDQNSENKVEDKSFNEIDNESIHL